MPYAMSRPQIQKHLQTGVSYMFPVLMLGGLCRSIAQLGAPHYPGNALLLLMERLGELSFLLAVPVAAAYTAFSLADRPGMMPALVLGYYAVTSETGYVGAMLCAFLVSGCILLAKRFDIPDPLNSIYSVVLVPLAATVVTGSIFYFLLVPPLVWLRLHVLDFFLGMGGLLRFGVGAVVAAMIACDMGGQIGKRSTIFSNACLAEGWFLPVSAKIIGCMVPSFVYVLAELLRPRQKGKIRRTREMGKVALAGACQITESVLPYARKEPRRIVISITVGAALAGGLVMYWSCACQMPHGGIFILPLIQNPGLFLLALLAGSLCGGLLLVLLRLFMKHDPPRGTADLLDDKHIEINF